MSNMIKGYSVRYDDEVKITIDTHFRIDKELEAKFKNVAKLDAESSGEFVEGLQAVVLEALPTEQETLERASIMIEDAKTEASEILEKAKKEAELIKSEAFSTAQKKGYEEGVLQLQRETQILKSEYEEKKNELGMEYDALITSLEPQTAQVITELIEKVTGILATDYEDVIVYLIKKAMKNFGKCDSFTIQVSEEDYENVSSQRDILLSAFGREVTLFIMKDSGLSKNQCLIETELKVINCSLDIQLKHLIADIKLLGGI